MKPIGYIKIGSILKKEINWIFNHSGEAYLACFFVTVFFNSIKNDSEVNTIRKAEFSASRLATAWVIFVILGDLLGRMGNIKLNILGLIIAIPTVLFFLPVQNYINTVNDSIEPRPRYNEWSIGHFVCLTISILLWTLIIYRISLLITFAV